MAVRLAIIKLHTNKDNQLQHVETLGTNKTETTLFSIFISKGTKCEHSICWSIFNQQQSTTPQTDNRSLFRTQVCK